MGRAQFIIDNPGLGLSSNLTDVERQVFYGDGLSKFGWGDCAQFAILLEKYLPRKTPGLLRSWQEETRRRVACSGVSAHQTTFEYCLSYTLWNQMLWSNKTDILVSVELDRSLYSLGSTWSQRLEECTAIEVLWLCLQGKEQGHQRRSSSKDDCQGAETSATPSLLSDKSPPKLLEVGICLAFLNPCNCTTLQLCWLVAGEDEKPRALQARDCHHEDDGLSHWFTESMIDRLEELRESSEHVSSLRC